MMRRFLIAALVLASAAVFAPSASATSTRHCRAPVAVHHLTVSGAARATCYGARNLARRYRDDGAVAQRTKRYRGQSGSRIVCTRGRESHSTGDWPVSCVVRYSDAARAVIRFTIEP
jgi:hypothetical protein